MKSATKKILIHLGCLVLLYVVACVYMHPSLKGLELPQGDIQNYKAMINETVNFREATGESTRWNSSLFSGMPNYQVGGGPAAPNVWYKIRKYCLQFDWGLTQGVTSALVLYLLGFYIALACIGLNPLLALLGALAFGFGSYNIIILEAGHITKANAMALMMPILAAIMLCFKGVRQSKEKGKIQWWTLTGGAVLFMISLTMQLSCNHIQITYYTVIGALLLGITYAVYAVKEKWIAPFFLAVALMGAGAGLSLMSNTSLLFTTEEYSKYTMRGGSEITVTPDDLYNETTPQSDYTSTGLSIDYAYSWSYGVGETYTLLVPGARGGGSGEKVGTESASYKNFHQKQMPLYWGDQPFTSGPVYFGAIICFLFILGLFVVRGPERWWLLAATIVAMVLSWGRHCMAVNEWLFYHLPLYNKFRTPSMALTLANVTMVFMAILALKRIFFDRDLDRKRLNRALYWSGGITAGILIIGLLLSGGLAYSGVGDEQMARQYGNQWSFIQNIFIQDRKALFVGDSWRSMLFVALAFALLWLHVNDKLKRAWLPLSALLLLVVVDLWGVDRRYLSADNFVKARNIELHPDEWDLTIDQLAEQYGDKDYRVFNLAVNTFNDAKPSAFHHQIGGYSAVKLRRYQDIIDFYISRHINWDVLNMLNMRYIVTPNRQVQRNDEALGNAWFVDNYQLVPDANAEILALNTIKPAQTAIVDSSQWYALVQGFSPTADPLATIEEEYQQPYHPGYLRYRSHSATDQMAVFSEVFYAPDWRAYIDGKPADYFRANYILRAMIVPAGDHLIEFRNEAPREHKLNVYTRIGSWLVLLLALAALTAYIIYQKKDSTPQKAKTGK